MSEVISDEYIQKLKEALHDGYVSQIKNITSNGFISLLDIERKIERNRFGFKRGYKMLRKKWK